MTSAPVHLVERPALRLGLKLTDVVCRALAAVRPLCAEVLGGCPGLFYEDVPEGPAGDAARQAWGRLKAGFLEEVGWHLEADPDLPHAFEVPADPDAPRTQRTRVVFTTGRDLGTSHAGPGLARVVLPLEDLLWASVNPALKAPIRAAPVAALVVAACVRAFHPVRRTAGSRPSLQAFTALGELRATCAGIAADLLHNPQYRLVHFDLGHLRTLVLAPGNAWHVLFVLFDHPWMRVGHRRARILHRLACRLTDRYLWEMAGITA